ncbi:hypothetical protein CFBP498_15300 [Xanthomonas hortorum pv. vitians]|uniref:Uncharacterized protein n=1 Tax=Xanthomonas hortorum pv. vitians TaxID=83224 RepID=A0A6V7CNK7_9XANT|nr:hypothetical protein CFBP498_15300 [Xanthomonas hortorum pv. vitians]CAD0319739.1 hypothetical protein CFBP498_15300 [Xanthomonas hortorum pv. vitians]
MPDIRNAERAAGCLSSIPDSRFPIPDSRFPIPDSRFTIHDSRFPALKPIPRRRIGAYHHVQCIVAQGFDIQLHRATVFGEADPP